MGSHTFSPPSLSEAERAHADLIRRYLSGAPLPTVPAQHVGRSHLMVTVAMGVAAVALVGFSALVLWPDTPLRHLKPDSFPRLQSQAAAMRPVASVVHAVDLRRSLATPAEPEPVFEAPAAGLPASATPYEACMAMPSMDGAMEDCSVWLQPERAGSARLGAERIH